MLRFGYDPTVGSDIFMPLRVRAVVTALCLWTVASVDASAAEPWPLVVRGRPTTTHLVCFYRASPWRHWSAEIDPPDRAACKEILLADVGGRRLYLGFDDFVPGSYQLGQADAYCPPTDHDRFGSCASSFLRPSFPGKTNYRSLDIAAVSAAIAESGIADDLNRLADAASEAQRNDELTIYRSAFEVAVDLEHIRTFRARYAGDDPDGLIPRLASRLAELEASSLASANTVAELKAWIRRYGDEDAPALIAGAKKKLMEADAREKAAAAIQRHVADQNGLLGNIAYCKHEMRADQEFIRREREVAAISGAANPVLLHQAGANFVACRDAIPKLYERYRSGGGKRPLERIN